MPRRQPEGPGNAGVTDASLHRVEAREQFRSFGHGFLQAPTGDAEDVGQRDAHQRFRGGEGHRPRHVAHRVVLHPMNRDRWRGVGGFAAGGHAAALVDGHVHDHRAGSHLFNQGLIDEGGCSSPGRQHSPDHQIGRRDKPLQQAATADHAHQPTAAIRLQAAQAFR